MSVLNRIIKTASRFLVNRAARAEESGRLTDLGLWGLDVNANGRLSVNGQDAVELVERFGSPLLVVNRKKLIEDARRALAAFNCAPVGSRILYSYKTNCIPGILKELHGAGLGAEVISPYELWLAERLGVPGEMTIYNGVAKTPESIEAALRRNILSINIDSAEEVETILTIADKLRIQGRVGIRLGFSAKSQFGLDVHGNEAMKVCERIAALKGRLEFSCIHFNVTSNSRWASTHKHYAGRAVEFMAEMKAKTGLVAQYLDIGGGFGVETTKNMSGAEYGMYRLFGCLPSPPKVADFPPIESFFNEIIEAIKAKCSELQLETPKIIIEPGRLITSKSEFLLTKVNTIKTRPDGTTYAMTGAGRLSMTFPCDFEYHAAFVADRPEARPERLYNVMGRVCTSADWMFKNRLLPKLNAGDVLAVMDAGAYFSSYSSNFAFQRPAIVMVSETGNASVLRAQESFEHLVAMDNI
ncbi:MAG: diaminopimelate decarboxylase [Deltaproteobacteria bacterium]|nr:diaminopimelate decarboxylase [Deltaproteobacteria bacterium]